MLLTLKSQQTNSVSVLNSLIEKLGIPVSSFTVKQDLEEHPDYPSLLAMSDCLTNWKVPHDVYKLDKDDFSFSDLSLPCIAHFNRLGTEFILIYEIADGKLKFSDEHKNNKVLTESEFLASWDGVVLYAKRDSESAELNYKSALVKGWINRVRIPFLISILLVSVFLTIGFTGASSFYIGLLVLKLLGIATSVLLLMYSLNTNNPFIKNLCGLGKKNNCNAILKSDAAKVTSWLSWSEVGMVYFTGSFICLLINPDTITLLAWLNLACLPYTFYSIGYQIKIKNWCLLCCTVQVLLWMEACVFVMERPYGLNLSPSLNNSYILWCFILSFLLPIAIWVFLKPLMLKAQQSQPLKQQLNKFKYNSELFHQLLTSQTRYAVPDDLMPLVLGNPEAETIITIVSNLFCTPCAQAHKTLDSWLCNRDDIQLKVIFTTANHDDDANTKVARHFTALSLLNDQHVAGAALSNWYAQRDKKYENWAASYPLQSDIDLSLVTEKQRAWCKMVEIEYTPTILINGYKLVDPYHLEDIQYLVS